MRELDFEPATFRGRRFVESELSADRTELARQVVTALVRSGSVLDPARLTNTAFHIHHPDRDLQRKIDPNAEQALADEWKRLKSTIVDPVLAPATPASGSSGVIATTGTTLLVGDSHTVGAFGTELVRLLGTKVERHAKVGSAVMHWLPVMPDLLRTHQPSLVIIALGANMRGYPSPRGTSNQIRKLVDVVRRDAPGARLVWIGPPRERDDTDATLERFNAIVRAGLDDHTTFIDSGPHTPRYVGTDGVHYATAAATAWARGVFSELR